MKKDWWAGAEVCSRLILFLVFGSAAWPKLRDPQAFADSIHSFALLPTALISPLALGLPVLEFATAVLLALGIRRRASGGLALAMSVVFAIALAQALIRGLPVDCGCFGSGAPSTAKNVLGVVRDLGLAGLAVIVICAEKRRQVDASGSALTE